MSGGENFVSVRKLPWTWAHASPPSAGPPPKPLLPQSSLPGGEAEPALSHCREGTGSLSLSRWKRGWQIRFRTAFAPGRSDEPHEKVEGV